MTYQGVFALLLIKQRALDHNTTSPNKTYSQASKTNNQIIHDHTTLLKH